MKIRRIIILVFALGASCMAFAQSNADSLFNQSKMLKSTQKVDSALIVGIEAVKAYHENKNLEGANDELWHITNLKLNETMLAIFSDFITEQGAQIRSEFPIEAANLRSNVGLWLVKSGEYTKALPEFEKAAEDLYALNDTTYLHTVYFRLGQTVQLSRSDGAQALVYANQAERVYAQKKDQKKSFLGKIQYLKGRGYQSSEHEKAIECFRKAQELNPRIAIKCEMETVKAYSSLKMYKKAYASVQKASKLHYDAYGKVDELCLIYEARLLGELDRFDESISKFEEALIASARYYSPTDPDIAKIYFYKAQVFNRNRKFEKALDNIQKVYSSFYPKYKPKFNTDVPDISKMTPNHWVLDALKEQGRILTKKYQDSKDSKLLELAIHSFNKALNDLEARRKEMENWDSKEQYNQILYSIYEQALVASARLYQSDPSIKNKKLVFTLLEKSKATLLQENLEIKKEKEDIPEAILNQEKELLQEITDLETKILKVKNYGNESSTKTLENELFDSKQRLSSFKKNNSTYYARSTVSGDSSSYEKHVDNLPLGSMVMSYHISDADVLNIGFNKDELYINFIPKYKKFDADVLKMRTMLSDWNSTLSNRSASEKDIRSCAGRIGDSLLEPLKNFTNTLDHIIIMPNGALHNIPFELLPIPGEDQIMIHKYDVSYAYLFSSFPSTGKSSTKSLSFAGFAPKYNKETQEISTQIEEGTIDKQKLLALRSGLIDIPEARKSVLALAEKYDGTSWIDDQATKENFIKEAKNYDVLHLGMHSLLNENTSSLSSLVFSGEMDNELYLREVRSMEIPAKLVVLSACNTGVGRNVVGEGPFSLARAFFYAGAESTLMSLWQVPDVQTSKIMQLFYNNLEMGLDKSAALAQAKRDYIKTASVLESHPAFWSGFVLVGDTSAITLESSGGWLFENTKYLLIALFLIILLCAVLRKRGTKSSI